MLVAAAALTPVAAAGGHGHTPQAPPHRVVVRTELVPADDGAASGSPCLRSLVLLDSPHVPVGVFEEAVA